MGTLSSHIAQGKGITDLLFTFESDYTHLYRLLLFTAGILYVFFGYLHLIMEFESLLITYHRIALGIIWLTLALLTYISRFLQKKIRLIVYASAYLIMFHQLYFAVTSNFSVRHVISLIITFFIASNVFKRPQHLNLFLGVNLLFILTAIFLSRESSINKFLLINSFLIIGTFTFVVLGLKLKIQDRLKASEDLFRNLFNENAEAIMVVNTETGLIEDCNKQTTLLLDHGHKSSLLNTDINAYLQHPLSQEEFQQIKEVCLNKNIWHKQLKLVRKQGTSFWGELAISMIDVGTTPFFLYRISDITQQREAQAQMRLLESVAINITDAVMITEADMIDPPGPIINYVNNAFTYMTGYTAEETIGRSPRFLQGPKTDRFELQKIKEALREKRAVEAEVINYRKDGSEFWVSLSIAPIVDERGEVTHFVSIQRDITDRKQTLEKLARSELRYRTLIENTQEVFYSLSLDFKFTYVSSNWSKVLGHPAKELEGKDLLEFIHPDDIQVCVEYLQKVTETNKLLPWVEYRIAHKDGSWKWHSSSASLIRDKNNMPMYYVGVCHDLSDRKKAEDFIKASLHEKEVLLKEIHHRVKNNMTVISSLLSIQANYIDDEHAKGLFEESKNRIKSMALIHDKLYQHESLANIEFSSYINELVSNIASSYNSQASDIEVEFNTEKLYLEITKAVPCGLIINEIFSNAYKHAFKERSYGKIRVTFLQANHNYLLEISDNGVGLPEDFDVYTSPSLGMQLILALVEQISGTLEIINNQGTTFKLLFKQ